MEKREEEVKEEENFFLGEEEEELLSILLEDLSHKDTLEEVYQWLSSLEESSRLEIS